MVSRMQIGSLVLAPKPEGYSSAHFISYWPLCFTVGHGSSCGEGETASEPVQPSTTKAKLDARLQTIMGFWLGHLWPRRCTVSSWNSNEGSPHREPQTESRNQKNKIRVTSLIPGQVPNSGTNSGPQNWDRFVFLVCFNMWGPFLVPFSGPKSVPIFGTIFTKKKSKPIWEEKRPRGETVLRVGRVFG